MSTLSIDLIEERSTLKYRNKIILLGGFFFIFGFVTWLNGTLIPYLRIACELEEWESYLVTFAFYIAYTVMAIPCSIILQHTGLVKGMRLGLMVMALGCLCFIPAALYRTYVIFLGGLFIVATGLAILQTAVNPYVTLLGPSRSAAQRISIMGICSKTAGIIAPLALGAIILNNSGQLIQEIRAMDEVARTIKLRELAKAVILPYSFIAAGLILIAFLLRYARLPEIKVQKTQEGNAASLRFDNERSWNIQLMLGFFAIFTSVGTEVVSGDTIANYGLYHGISLDIAKTLTSYSLASGIAGYLFGAIAIPRFISQEKCYLYSNILGILLILFAVNTSATFSIAAIAFLNFANAILWPAVWPQALRNVPSELINRASAVLIMGIAGGAVMPLAYGALSTVINNQAAYVVLIPCYVYNLYYWLVNKNRH